MKMENSAEYKDNFEPRGREFDGIFLNVKRSDVYKTALEAVEKPLIEKALERTFGNQLKAAKILGISRNTLRTKIGKFGIDPEKWKI
jgi:DNA-binding protein Fis